MKRQVAAAVITLGATIGFGQVADAYPPDPPEAEVDDPTPTPGGDFVVTVPDCVEGETVEITFEGVTETTTCTDGTASASFAAPTSGGTFTGTVTTEGGSASFAVTVVVEDLPATGGGDSAGTVIWMGGGLLIAGAAMLTVGVRRRRHPLAA